MKIIPGSHSDPFWWAMLWSARRSVVTGRATWHLCRRWGLTLAFKAPLALLGVTWNQEALRELLCLVFSFSACCPCWLGRAPRWPEEISPVTIYISPLPAAASSGAGHRRNKQLSSSTSPPGCCRDRQLACFNASDQCSNGKRRSISRCICFWLLSDDDLCAYWQIIHSLFRACQGSD